MVAHIIMVSHALVCYPNFNTSKIEAFRKKYDPHYNLIKPHITLIFPIDNTSLSRNSLLEHIKSVINNWGSFNIELGGLTKSWDHWLFLLVKEGKKEIIELHEDLYQGILLPYFRNDLEYIPHITIGRFIKKTLQNSPQSTEGILFDEISYNIALEEAQALNLIYQTEVKVVHLIQINEEFTQTKNLKEFNLK
ncbi:MAG: 2'-5' RNA ligase family protein [Promethearchaeota archaeon]